MLETIPHPLTHIIPIEHISKMVQQKIQNTSHATVQNDSNPIWSEVETVTLAKKIGAYEENN
jgi:hypothetical protein